MEIVFLLLLALAACHQAKVPEPVEGPTYQLQAVDSLMWQRPDSALALLLPWFDTVHTDETFDNHYANLLLSELLYKNDYAQTNRTELLDAVAYFDNTMQVPEPVEGPSKKQMVFLCARAHYINGVGYYEQDSVVEACQEYIKALETMENHYKEKELVGDKARFMTYTYNRLGDMFSEQFMMESAISCYKNSLAFSYISPISSYSISNAMYRIGKQYAMKGNADSANYYYSQAISKMSDSVNPLYRDIISTRSILYYQLTHEAEKALWPLKQMIVSSEDYDEMLTRYLVIGDIYFEEQQYDSAQHYLKLVFEGTKDDVSRIQAAEYLRILCDSLCEKEESNFYIQFLAIHKPMEYETDAEISNLSEQFKNYLERKQRQQIEKEKDKEWRKTVGRIIGQMLPIVLFIAITTVLVMRNRNKKDILAKETETARKIQEESQRHEQEVKRIQTEAGVVLEENEKKHAEAIELERQAHNIEKRAISGRLKRSNQELRELRSQIKKQEEMAGKTKLAASFAEEPICRLILERVNEGRFLSQMDFTIYRAYALDKIQLTALRNAADRHYNQFTLRISRAHPELTSNDLDYCCLYLLNLSDADVSALMQRAYNTINERNSKLRRIFGADNAISAVLQAIANESLIV